MLLQIAVCLPFINSFPIALDEPFSIFWAQQDLGDQLKLFASENNPPLHFFALHFWIDIFGIDPISVRSLSLLFSVLTIPFLFKLSRKFVSQQISILIILLFIFSRFHHYHAMEARVYSLFTLLFTLILLELYKLIFEKSNDWRIVLRLAIWNSLLLYAHYLGMLIMVGEFLVILVFAVKLNYRILLYFLGSVLLSLILYMPGINWFVSRIGNFSEHGTWVPDPHPTELYGNIIRFFNNTFSFVAFSSGLLILILISYIRFKRNIKSIFNIENKDAFILLIFFGFYLGMFIFSYLVQPIFLDRYLLFTTIPLYIAAGILMRKLITENLQRYSLILILPLVFSMKFTPDNNREPHNEVETLNMLREPNSRIVICPPFYDLTFLYHYSLSGFQDYKNIDEFLVNERISKAYNFNDIEMWKGETSVIFLDANSEFLYPDNTIRSGLENVFDKFERYEFKGGVSVTKFYSENAN
ncbi:MAG: glycosyltransferase family 39 protein [Crocinitomicaceae bacterium]|nr:glycosyltransferase family 39 protein [Crocinitomicaceae bacterium]